jgi:surfeit locus 1 family protein
MTLRTRLQQVLVVLLGTALAMGMVLAGRWQLDVYREQGAAAAAERAAEPPLPLLEVAPAGAPVAAGYGRSVSFEGTYDASRQLLVPVPTGGFRVLTALRQAGGSTVAVVRGQVAMPTAPDPPAGPVRQTGLLLPSEAGRDAGVPAGQLASVRVPALAQLWPDPLVDGFVTLTPAESRAQKLEPAAIDLPKSGGRLRNGAYAVQWWLFAAFAIAMAFRVARDLGERDGEILPTKSAAPVDPT